jgi:hypothetical protein
MRHALALFGLSHPWFRMCRGTAARVSVATRRVGVFAGATPSSTRVMVTAG